MAVVKLLTSRPVSQLYSILLKNITVHDPCLTAVFVHPAQWKPRMTSEAAHGTREISW
jgi:hypothetical protein